MTARAKLLFITTGLESGGAEMSLYKLVTRMDKARFDCSVVSLTDAGPSLGARIQAEGIPLHCLGFRRGLPDPRMVTRLARYIAETKPDLIQTWMYHADLVGALAAGLTRRLGRLKAPVVWSVHTTNLVRGKTKAQTLLVVGLNSRLSHRFASRVLCCSEAAREAHLDLGYRADTLQVIPSGIDTAEFVPDLSARDAVRRELALSPTAPLIGLSARFDPQKDHATFFQAAGLLHQVRPDAHFLLWGVGIVPENNQLMHWVKDAGLERQTHLLGLRPDTARLTAALDAATCCSSYGESFALVVGEALACGIPTVSTDMLGPVTLMGGCGWVVPVKDPQALSAAWQEMLSLAPDLRQQRGNAARMQIEQNFSLRKTVQSYEAFYAQMLSEYHVPPLQEELPCRV